MRLAFYYNKSIQFVRFLYFKSLFNKIGKNTAFGHAITYCNAKGITIGHRSIINHHIELLAQNSKIKIGNDVLIAPYVFITTNSHGYERVDIPISKQKEIGKKVIIENGVWIGTHAVILPGVTIGHDAIVGAGAVVTKDVPPFAVAVGVPAKVIKYRRNVKLRKK